jgi:hypothetical protein
VCLLPDEEGAQSLWLLRLHYDVFHDGLSGAVARVHSTRRSTSSAGPVEHRLDPAVAKIAPTLVLCVSPDSMMLASSGSTGFRTDSMSVSSDSTGRATTPAPFLARAESAVRRKTAGPSAPGAMPRSPKTTRSSAPVRSQARRAPLGRSRNHYRSFIALR